MGNLHRGGLVAAALGMLFAGGMAAGAAASGVPQADNASVSSNTGIAQGAPAAPRTRKSITPAVRARATRSRKTGPGWSPRQVQRMAAKRRNVAKNRRVHARRRR